MPLGDLTSTVLIAMAAVIALVGFVLAYTKVSVRGGSAVGASGIIAVVLIVLIYPLISAAPTAIVSSTCPVAGGCAVNTLENAAPALISGESWSSVTNTLTVDVVFNSTGDALHVCAAVTPCASSTAEYVLLPLKLIRTDSYNGTAAFPMNVASTPCLSSLGSSPTTYCFVGYKAATGTTPATYQIFWSAGTTASLNPTVVAPTVTTNILPDSLPVTAFSSALNVLHISLAGSNSTSAPLAWGQALQNFTSYPETISIGSSSPSLVTIQFVVIGWN
jgi:hypothetical protein